MVTSLGRNEPCHCGSGKKYKHCCLVKDEAAERAARVQPADDAPAAAPAGPHAPPGAAPRHATQQPWKKSQGTRKGFPKFSAPRKVGGG